MRVRLFITITVLIIVLAAASFIFFNQGPKTAATVNGVAIPVSFIDRQVKLLQGEQPNIFAGKQGVKREDNFRQAALDYLIKLELISQEAKKLKLNPSEKAITKEINELKKGFQSEAKFNQALREQNLTIADLKRLITYREAEARMVSWLTKKVTITDEEIQAYYQKNQDKFKQPEVKRIRHILVKNKKKAAAIEAQLNSGVDFAYLVKRFTEDQATRNRGGDLGYKSLSQLPPAIAAEVAKLKKGERSHVFKTAEGYHIIQVDNIVPARLATLDEVKNQIKQKLLEDKRREKFSAWLKQLRQKATIEIKVK